MGFLMDSFRDRMRRRDDVEPAVVQVFPKMVQNPLLAVAEAPAKMHGVKPAHVALLLRFFSVYHRNTPG